jgi:hypothetical protein
MNDKLNVLCIGDVHIQTNNTTDIKLFMNKLEKYIKRNIDNIDLIILMKFLHLVNQPLHILIMIIMEKLIVHLQN